MASPRSPRRVAFSPEVVVRKIPQRRYNVRSKIGPRRSTIVATGSGFCPNGAPCAFVLTVKLAFTAAGGWEPAALVRPDDWTSSPSTLSWTEGTCTTTRFLTSEEAIVDAVERLRFVPPPPVDDLVV
jgi:hypothetical protein